MSRLRSVVVFVAAFAVVTFYFLPGGVCGAERPDSALVEGISQDRLRRLDAVMERAVADGRIAGVVTYVARNGRVVHHQAHGMADREAGRPMAKDAIVRIASMSKGLTSVAAMMLVEEGKLALLDPVSRYVPEFRNTTVAVAPPADAAPGARWSVVPAKREITIRDLLTHTAGIGYGYGPAAEVWKEAGIQGWYFAERNEPVAAVVERMAKLPMDAQPGEKFVYGYNTDILGVVVERISGQSLAEFFQARILGPLQMADTHFYLPKEKASRLAAVYAARPDGSIERAPDPGTGQGAYVDGPRVAFSGGAGLLSTASDYGRFLQMLANGGELEGARLLGPKTVELMTVNHVGALNRNGDMGFGLGFYVTEHLGRAGHFGSVGDFGWGGAYFTEYFADPKEKVVAVFLSQLLPRGNSDLGAKFRTLVYQSIVEPSAR